MLKLGSIYLNINQGLLERHKRITGDTDEIAEHVYRTMIENETGVSFEVAAKTYSSQELSLIIEERINVEISAFGG